MRLVVFKLLIEVFVTLQQALDNVLIDLQRLVQVFVLHQQILILLLQILHLYKPFLKTSVFRVFLILLVVVAELLVVFQHVLQLFLEVGIVGLGLLASSICRPTAATTASLVW